MNYTCEPAGGAEYLQTGRSTWCAWNVVGVWETFWTLAEEYKYHPDCKDTETLLNFGSGEKNLLDVCLKNQKFLSLGSYQSVSKKS